MSDYFMNYGDDWPPKPEPAADRTPPRRRRWPLWKTCALWIGVYVVMGVGAVIAVRAFVPPGFDPYKPSPAPASASVHHP